MNDETISITTIITLTITALIGLILIYIGSKKESRKQRFIGFGFLLAAGVMFFVESAELRSTLTALAAVIAVIVSAMSFDESKQLRKETMEREIRDRNERIVREKRERTIQLLTDIISWAEDLAGCASLEKMVIQQLASNILRRYRHILSKKAYIEEIISSFEDRKFSKLLSNIISGRGSLKTVMAGLNAIEHIDIQIGGKQELKQFESNQKNPDYSKLVNISVELAALLTTAALKWNELMPKDKQLADDVDNLIKHASKLKMNLISEYSPID